MNLIFKEEKRMKNFFIAFSVLAALTLCVVPAQANLGLPDDVPGSDAVVPFLVAMDGGINTLAVFTDVRGYGLAGTKSSEGWSFHYTVNTIASKTVHDDILHGTNHDIASTDAFTIISDLSPATLVQLEIDLDMDGVNDHWAGYIYFVLDVSGDNPAGWNQMIGQTLLLNLQAGQAAGANTWFKELIAGRMEDWSAYALAAAEARVLFGAPEADAVTGFGLYPRYYINDANTGQTCLFIWKSENWGKPPLASALVPDLHIYFYNDDEKKVSSNLPLPYELNIICLDPWYLPVALFSGYPREGWLAIEVPDLNGNGFAGFEDMDWAGYTWIYATGPARESWSYLTQMHRDVEWTWGEAGTSWDHFGQ